MLSALFHVTRGKGASLEWRIRAFFLSAVLGLAGIFLELSWLVAAALIVLIGGLALGAFVARKSGSEELEPTIQEQRPTAQDQEPTIPEPEPTIPEPEPTLPDQEATIHE